MNLQRLLTLIAMAAALPFSAGGVYAQDAVTVRMSPTSTATFEGKVVDYSGAAGLVLDTKAGQRRVFAAGDVLRVDTIRSERHGQADAAFDRGQFEQALAMYREARQLETRAWVSRLQTAAIVQSLVALGRDEAACREFALLVQSDPETPFFEVIPLAWLPRPASPSLESLALEWIRSDRSPLLALLGASHLLPTRHRNAATSALERLTGAKDARVMALATAQLWRTRILQASPRQIAQWDDAVGLMPHALRFGPYAVVARGYEHLDSHEDAATAWLHIPIEYPKQRHLAAHALVRAAKALESLGRTSQAVRLLNEVTRDYGDTPSAADARARLAAISSAS